MKPRQYVEYLGDGIFKILQGVGYKFLIGFYIQKHFIKTAHFIKFNYIYVFLQFLFVF